MRQLSRQVLSSALTATTALASCVSGDLSKDAANEHDGGAGSSAGAARGGSTSRGGSVSVAGQGALPSNGIGASSNAGTSGSAGAQVLAGASGTLVNTIASAGGAMPKTAGGAASLGGIGGSAALANSGEFGGASGAGTFMNASGGHQSTVNTDSSGGIAATIAPTNGGSSGASSNTSGGILATGGAMGSTAASGGTGIGGAPSTGGVATGGAMVTGGEPGTGGTATSGMTGAAGNPVAAAGSGGAPLCSPNRSFCMGNDIHICGQDGMTSSKAASCLPKQYCDGLTATCVECICNAINQPACDENVATTCNDNCSGFKGFRTDCGATGQTCSHGQCYSKMVDTVGDAIELSPQANMWGGSEVLVVYSVSSTRYLIQVEQYGTIPKGVATTCSVYESDTKTGTFYLKDPGKGGTSIATTGDVIWGWQPCGFDPPVELTAGKYYAIGLASAIPNANYFPILWSQQAGTYQTTFGTAYSRGNSIRTTSITVSTGATQIPDQRLTTVP